MHVHNLVLRLTGVVGITLSAFLLLTPSARGAGVLTPKGAAQQPIQIRDHHVRVTLNNGFAQTEVTQTFFNPNPQDLEAVYSFPLPKGSSLSELTIYAGERELHGEVVEKQMAREAYEQEKAAGRDTALAEKNAFYRYEFAVSPVKANAETRVRFVYYQPLEIDTGVGRYVYPLREGGTDDAGTGFWSGNAKVEGTFRADVELKSAVPVADVRVPGLEGITKASKLGEGHYKVETEAQGVSLDRDFVFYYRLAENLPGRIELVAYRASEQKPGTFMLVVTPGADLKPLAETGADYTFVLDVSGSMQGKLPTLAAGVNRALGTLRPQDRFRVITFAGTAQELIGFTPATRENVIAACDQVAALKPRDSTNLYAALQLAMSGIDADRATSLILVTDGVANSGEVNAGAFQQLMKTADVRVFGFLMGNGANWPLMRTICDASGGFYAGVSNDDDLVGQILLAKSKMTSEAMHDATLKITGVRTQGLTRDGSFGKIYRGRQLVMFGRYEKGGLAHVALSAKLTGADKTYATTFTFPDVTTDNPELERLWALDRIDEVQQRLTLGQIGSGEGQQAIRELGIAYQLVTDETSMVVMADDAFAQRGIDRRNQARVASEHAAQQVRAAQPAANNRIDQNAPAFSNPAPGLAPRPGAGGGGGGAIDPITGGAAVLVAAAGWIARRANDKRRRR